MRHARRRRPRPLLASGLALALAATACGPGLVQSDRPARPNVLLVSIDTLRADHVGAYGAAFAETPTLDTLAREGARFATAIAPTPLTLPSHVSLHTGLLPPRHGVRHNGLFRLDEAGPPTLAERFRAAGYATGAVVGSVVLGARFGLARGFDRYDDESGAHAAAQSGFPERDAAAVSAAALRFLASCEEPFFLWIHYYDPHAVYRPPAPFAERFRDRPYDGEIAYVDASLGRVLEALAQNGRRERTLVAVTSDHGESLGEHGEHTHGYLLYDASLAVPLLLRGPGVPAGATPAGVVSLVSLAPTLLALAGLPALPQSDGEDLRARLRGDAPAQPSRAYAESLATHLDHGWSSLYALRGDDFLYVRAPRPELYDVAADPAQRVNLLGAEVSASARAQADGAEAVLAAQLAAAGPLRTERVDAALRAQLDALGYAVGDAPAAETGIDPKDGIRFVAPFVRARSALAAGAVEEAAAELAPLLAAMPRSARAHELAARVALAQDDLERALAHAGTASALVPDSASAHALLGELRLRAGDLGGAERAFAEALAHDPSDASLHVQAAELAERRGDPARALDGYRRALELAPGLGAAELGAAIQEVRLGLSDDASERVARAGSAARDPVLLNRLALAWIARGELERAEALLREVLAAHPGEHTARHNLVRLLEDAGRAAEAAALAPAGG